MRKLYLFIISIAFNISTFALNVDRVEPMFWWVGMKNPNLQLLIHGNNVSQYQVSIKYQGVKVTKVNKVENPNYLFVDLTIDSKSAKAGKFTIDMLQNGKTEGSYTYELKNRNSGSANRQGFSSADVVYLLMPDRFANGDPSNDNADSQPEKANRTIDY